MHDVTIAFWFIAIPVGFAAFGWIMNTILHPFDVQNWQVVKRRRRTLKRTRKQLPPYGR